MNSVVAIGAPGSLIRHFQEHPEDGVALLRACNMACFSIDAMNPHDLLVRELKRHGLGEQMAKAMEQCDKAVKAVPAKLRGPCGIFTGVV